MKLNATPVRLCRFLAVRTQKWGWCSSTRCCDQSPHFGLHDSCSACDWRAHSARRRPIESANR
jgi:hypothetical protein